VTQSLTPNALYKVLLLFVGAHTNDKQFGDVPQMTGFNDCTFSEVQLAQRVQADKRRKCLSSTKFLDTNKHSVKISQHNKYGLDKRT
jgi:hypothetical protein